MAAQYIDGPAEVTLRLPPPLAQPLRVEPRADGVVLLVENELIAEAHPTTVDLHVPAPVGIEHARRASSRYSWIADHPFPTCFVCGPEREEGDGLRLFPGPVDDGSMYAASWVPEPSLGRDDGTVRDEFIWAALDCPSGIVTDLFGDVGLIVLGRMAADITCSLTAGFAYTVQAWPLEREGRKLRTASAIFSADGQLCAVARTVWIELSPQD
jgi:hypothetical protein